jgi:hypothetical protein
MNTHFENYHKWRLMAVSNYSVQRTGLMNDKNII